MTREHKYRAWDDEAEEFIYSDQNYDDRFFEFSESKLVAFRINPTGCAGDMYEPPSPGAEKLAPPEEFTGKRDRNSIEIYENDSVKDEEAGISKDTVVWNEQELSWWLLETNVSLGSLIFSRVQHYDPITGQPYWTELEVIGNAHSQPEGEQL